jgi:glycolate oxidase iron-sulfur subunit
VARAAFGESEAAMVQLLAAAGYRVERRDDPPCCGALARHAGEADLARRLACGFFQDDDGADGIWVPTAAGCGAHLKDLAGMFPPGEGQDRARELAPRVRDLSEALLEGPRPLPLRRRPRRVLFQDPCHLRHGQGLSEGPRRLLRQTGAELVEPNEADLCCGSAGTYNLFQADLAFRIGRRKAGVLLATGARCIVTANPGCHLQVEAHVRGSEVEVVSLARFLAAHLPPLPGEVGQVII